MNVRPHRFLQYLQDLGGSEQWHEVAAVDGRAAGARRAVSSVRLDAPGRKVREIKAGIRLVLKWLVRAIYVSPLLIVGRFVLDAIRPSSGDMLVVVFVLLVVGFFLVVNLYIVWSVVEHFRSRGLFQVRVPFGDAGEDRTGVFVESPDVDERIAGRVSARGVVRRVDELLPGSRHVLRDLWATESASPWRFVEATDFAVVAEGERPVIVRVASAPIVVATPRKETVRWAVAQLTPGANAVFDMGPATAGDRAAEPVRWITLAEGDEVDLVGSEHGVIEDVNHFELGERSCSLARGDEQALGPYRDTARGGLGTLVHSTPETPVWIRKVR